MSSTIWGLHAKTLSFTVSPKKKSVEVKSGKHGSQLIAPWHPIYLLENVMSSSALKMRCTQSEHQVTAK